jgi:prepilin-type N-terminal cleavage/methylation domain-containing protein
VQRPSKSAGFTLIEVLVAFVILSLVVTACLQVYSSSARVEASARWAAKASAVLHDKLGALDTFGLQPGQQINGQAADGLRWSVTVGQPVGAAGPEGAHSVIWVTGVVTDPTGKAYSASTARWRGEWAFVLEQ